MTDAWNRKHSRLKVEDFLVEGSAEGFERYVMNRPSASFKQKGFLTVPIYLFNDIGWLQSNYTFLTLYAPFRMCLNSIAFVRITQDMKLFLR